MTTTPNSYDKLFATVAQGGLKSISDTVSNLVKNPEHLREVAGAAKRVFLDPKMPARLHDSTHRLFDGVVDLAFELLKKVESPAAKSELDLLIAEAEEGKNPVEIVAKTALNLGMPGLAKAARDGEGIIAGNKEAQLANIAMMLIAEKMKGWTTTTQPGLTILTSPNYKTQVLEINGESNTRVLSGVRYFSDSPHPACALASTLLQAFRDAATNAAVAPDTAKAV